MIREAFILADPASPSPSVAGVPLLLRTVLVLQRAGVERCVVVGAAAPRDPRIRCATASVPALPDLPDAEPRLVIGPGAVIDPMLVEEVAARARPGEAVEVAADGVAVRVAPGTLVRRNGATVAAPRGRGFFRSVAAPALERELLRGLENPRDGYLDRALHRRLSRPLTRLLLRTPLTPNAVTVLGVAAGVAGGCLLGAASWWLVAAGVACLVLSGVLDCCDGELARLRFAESAFGHWLDVAGDTVVHVAVLGGLAARLVRTGPVPGAAVLGVLALGVAGAFGVISWSEQTEEQRHRVGAWENRVLDGVLSPLSTRDWYLCVIPFALTGRLDRLVLGAAIGAHAFWIAGFVLVRRVLRRAHLQGSAARVAQ